MKFASVILIAALLPPALAQAEPTIIPGEIFACEHPGDFVKGMKVLKGGRLEDILIFQGSHFPHACASIKANSEVFVEKRMQLGAQTLDCVRWEGRAACWWTLRNTK